MLYTEGMRSKFILLLTVFLYSCHIPNLDKTIAPKTEPGGNAPAPIATLTEEFSAPLTLDDVILEVPTAGNSWVKNNINETANVVTENGIQNWTAATGTIVTFIRLSQPGDLGLALEARAPGGNATIEVSVEGLTQTVTFSNTSLEKIFVGTFPVSKRGYTRISMKGVAPEGGVIAEIPSLFIGGSAAQGETYFINEDFYFARRGPSVNIGYLIPTSKPIEFFYTEVTVPYGNDVVGSFFMANGFSQGYFGIQVNSETERRVLFSVWSPFETDDPSQIPPEFRIILRSKGNGVITNDFGGEGSGGQSYLPYMWQAGQTYGFLVRAIPVANNSTEFTAWFFAPELGKWNLIASFIRPQTNTFITGSHSFLENFIPESGQFTRQALFGNQWAHTQDGEWVEVTQGTFGYDATADAKRRWDYQGGTKDDMFYLMNCGFFDDFTEVNMIFTRPSTGTPPSIRFIALP